MKPLLAIVGCVLVGCAGPKPERIVLTDSSVRSAQAEATGPTINLQTNSDKPPTNPLSSLMYFIRLTSNEPVELTQSEGNTQQAQLTKIDRQLGDRKFTVTCQFEFIGEGSQMNRFDHSATIQKRASQLAEGKVLQRRLAYIGITGGGRGSVRVRGEMTNGKPVAHEISLRFFAPGHRTPVTIGIHDIRNIKSEPHAVNQQVIKVNSLTFRHSEDSPKMEVSLASIQAAGASGLFSELSGRLKGTMANLFIPPVSIRPAGNQAMLDFAQAIAEGRPRFTFPAAH